MKFSSKKLVNILLICISSIFLLVLIFYIGNIMGRHTDITLEKLVFGFIVLGVCSLIFFLMKLLHDKNEKIYVLALFLLSLFLYTLWGLNAPMNPVSDYQVLYNGAKEILQGDFLSLATNPENYFYFYNFQIGYTVFIASIMKLFSSESLVLLHLVEILILSITNISLYFLIKQLFDKKIAMNTSLVYTLFIPNIMGSNILNNQHLAVLFIILSLLFLFNKKEDAPVWNYLYIILSGLFLALGYIMRQSTIIVFIAIFIYYVLDFMLHRNKRMLLVFVVFTLAFTLSQKMIDVIIQSSNLAPDSTLQAHTQYFKFWLGISKDKKGVFETMTLDAEHTQIYYDLKTLDFDYEAYNKISKDKILYEYTQNFPNTIKTIYEKMQYFVGKYDEQFTFSHYQDNATLREIVDNAFVPAGSLQYFIMIICTFMLSISNFKSQKFSPQVLFTLIFLGIFAVHIFIEVQTRYRFEQYFCLSIFTGVFLERIFQSYAKKKIEE